jgi:hypothetical protein
MKNSPVISPQTSNKQLQRTVMHKVLSDMRQRAAAKPQR